MKVKKCLLVAVISLLTTFFCIVPFSSVKALTQTNGSTDNYGTFYADTLYSSSGSSDLPDTIEVGVPPFTMTFSRTEGSMFKFEYTFNDTYTGYITLSITTDRAYVLNNCEFSVQGAWFGTLPSKTASTTTKTFQIAFKECTGFIFILHCPDPSVATKVFNNNTTYTKSMKLTSIDTNNEILDNIRDRIGIYLDYKTSDMADILSNTLTSLNELSDNLLTYPIEYERMSAYVFFRELGGNIIYNSDYPAPYINLTPNDSVRYWMYSGRTYYLSFLTTSTVSYADMFQYFTITPPSNGSLSFTRLTQNYITATGGFKLVSWSVSVTDTGTYTWQWIGEPVKVIPLYWNYADAPISEYVAYISGIPYHDSNSDILQDIYDAITNINQNNIDIYDDGLDSIGTFIDTVRNVLPTTTFLNNDINGLPNFTTQFTSVSNFVQSVYVDLTTTVPEFKWLIIVGLLAIVMRIIAV